MAYHTLHLFRLTNRAAALFFALVALHCASVFAGPLPSSQKAFAEQVIASILACNFDGALLTIDSAATADPANPLAPVLKIAALGMRDVDFEQTIDSAGFLLAYDTAMKTIAAYQQTHGVSSYSRTLDGFAKAIHSTFYLRLKSYVAALQNGLDALRLLEDARELDSRNADVDFFFGLYDYGKAELRKRLWWVLFWYPGGKKEGIRRLENCGKNGQLTREAARFSLADIYIRESQYDRADSLLKQLSAIFPESRFVLWQKAKYFESRKMYHDAARIYGQLAAQYGRHREGRHNSLVTRNHEAHMLKLSGQSKQAVAVCESILRDCTAKANREIRKDTQKLLDRINANRN